MKTFQVECYFAKSPNEMQKKNIFLSFRDKEEFGCIYIHFIVSIKQ